MITSELRGEITYGAAVECVASCPQREIVALGTRDGQLRCTDWKSERYIFEGAMPDSGAVSAVEFDGEGRVLVCGTEVGIATSWHTSGWKQAASVNIPGSVTNISFHPDGTNVMLGSSQGEIRNWKVAEEELSAYNIATARPVNGLSFRKNGDEIIVGLKAGYARARSGPQSNPNLDFRAYRNNLLFDFTLCFDGTRVATSTHNGIIRIWNTRTGSEIVAFSAPDAGSRRLALSGDGSKIASSSENGIIRVWKSDKPPYDDDIIFEVHEASTNCLCFSPDCTKILVCLKDEVQIWSLESKQKIGHVPSLGCSDTSFSCDGRFIVVGDSARANIWGVTSREIVFDTATTAPQVMSSIEARKVIKTCGPSAYRMWPSCFRSSGAGLSSSECTSNVTKLTVENFSNFIIYYFRPSFILFCEDVVVMTHYGVLVIFRIRQ